MIDQVDERISDWIRNLTDLTPSLALPDGSRAQPEISIYLLDVVDDPLRHNSTRPPLQPVLRYLISTSAPDPKQAHQILGLMLTAALNSTEFEVELGVLSENIWPALGVPPRPAFILRVPLPREYPPVESKLVTAGVEMRAEPMVDFFGLVLGPRQTPLARARVEMPNLYRFATTDARGRFVLHGVPAAPRVKTLLLIARKKQQLFSIAETGTPEEPVLLTLDLQK